MGELTRTFSRLSGELAIQLLGKPTYVSASALRWGRKYALVMHIAGKMQGRFYDFWKGVDRAHKGVGALRR